MLITYSKIVIRYHHHSNLYPIPNFVTNSSSSSSSSISSSVIVVSVVIVIVIVIVGVIIVVVIVIVGVIIVSVIVIVVIVVIVIVIVVVVIVIVVNSIMESADSITKKDSILENVIVTDDTILVNIGDIPSVSRWYDKWSCINDEDGVISRTSTRFEFEDEFNVNGIFKKQSGRLYHWKGYSWKTNIDRKVIKSKDDNNDEGDLEGTAIYLNRFSREFGENNDINFR